MYYSTPNELTVICNITHSFHIIIPSFLNTHFFKFHNSLLHSVISSLFLFHLVVICEFVTSLITNLHPAYLTLNTPQSPHPPFLPTWKSLYLISPTGRLLWLLLRHGLNRIWEWELRGSRFGRGGEVSFRWTFITGSSVIINITMYECV